MSSLNAHDGDAGVSGDHGWFTSIWIDWNESIVPFPGAVPSTMVASPDAGSAILPAALRVNQSVAVVELGGQRRIRHVSAASVPKVTIQFGSVMSSSVAAAMFWFEEMKSAFVACCVTYPLTVLP